MKTLEEIGQSAKKAAVYLNKMTTNEKNRVLLLVAEELEKQAATILEENQKDVEKAKENQMSLALIDRLSLDEGKIKGISEGIRQVVALEDPIGEVLSIKVRPNGLRIGQKRVPLGVIGIIFESRPNVTADAFSLCFKTGNAVILRGGSDAIYSNLAITNVIRAALKKENVPEGAVTLLEDTSRETATKLMKLNEYVDVLIKEQQDMLDVICNKILKM